MKHLFIPYEIAFSLKDKGFNEPCLAIYAPEDVEELPRNYVKRDLLMVPQGNHLWGESWPSKGFSTSKREPGYFIAAPLYQQVIDWFRNTHGINVLIHKEIRGKYYFWITPVGDNTNNFYTLYDVATISYFDDYYETLNNAIIETLKLIP